MVFSFSFRMREVDVADGKVLLIKDLNEFTAIGHKCSHYGAPLAKGSLTIEDMSPSI